MKGTMGTVAKGQWCRKSLSHETFIDS
eukprot:COSAG06_NODE_30021_length_546_cov_1.004474_1_plen_26_part_01